MFNPMLIWYAVAGAVILAILFEFIHDITSGKRRHAHAARGRHPRAHHLIGAYKERDLFFIPGDLRYNDQDDDFDDF